MTYVPGKIYPYIKPRGIVSGPDTAPTWHALVVPPQKERATREYFRAQTMFAFYPSQAETRTIRGRRVEKERPIITQHVYVQFRQAPQWDVMKENRRLITGVYSIGADPVVIPSDIIRHLQGLTVEAERLKQARAELLRVRAGDRAKIKEGPLSGFTVDVERVSNGMAWFDFITGGKGRAMVSDLVRDLPIADNP